MSWVEVKRCDPRARALADGHYSRQTPGHREFMPPGQTLVLLADGAVWGSSRNRFAGTTGLVALREGRRFVGIELNLEYARLAEERVRGMTVGLALGGAA